MTGIFLSYRRTDSAHALLILHRLVEEFGHDAVFFDREDIGLGRDYLQVIDDALERCACFVALIGPGWIASVPQLDQPADVVARELRAGLTAGKLLIPVSTGNASVFKLPPLPASLAPLAKRNGILLHDEFFEEDLEQLVLALRAQVQPVEPAQRPAGVEDLDRVQRLVSNIQMDALELVRTGQVHEALDGLYSGMGVLMAELQKAPANITLSTLLAYFYKEIGVSLSRSGEGDTAVHYLRLSGSLFRRLLPRAVNSEDRASILNGLGNALAFQGQWDSAIEFYRQALAILPGYAYAWHDLFSAYLEQARLGKPDWPKMQEALAGLKRSAPGYRGLDPEYIASLERSMPPAP
jgi:tetratricopeptide (TPR) repeat protein